MSMIEVSAPPGEEVELAQEAWQAEAKPLFGTCDLVIREPIT